MAHTPGPWEARPNDGQIILNGSNAYDIQEIFNEQGGFNPDDIRLMAAAPDLLAACHAIANDCERLIDGDDFSGMSDGDLFAAFLNALRPAIAKAEGRADDQ